MVCERLQSLNCEPREGLAPLPLYPWWDVLPICNAQSKSVREQQHELWPIGIQPAHPDAKNLT
eukprot:1090477-Pelagomonas_calceolata.AAC.2